MRKLIQDFALYQSTGIDIRKFCSSVVFISDKTTSTTQRHAASMASKSWKLGECSEPQKLSVFRIVRIGPKLNKLEEIFPGGEYGEIAMKKSE